MSQVPDIAALSVLLKWCWCVVPAGCFCAITVLIDGNCVLWLAHTALHDMLSCVCTLTSWTGFQYGSNYAYSNVQQMWKMLLSVMQSICSDRRMALIA